MKDLGFLKQAGTTYNFETDGEKIFVNGIEATYTKNRRGIPVVKFGEATIENIGVMKFRLEKAGVAPKEETRTKTTYTPTFTDYDNVFETWDMTPSERREFERTR